MQVRMPKFVDSHVGSEVKRSEKESNKKVVCMRVFLVQNITTSPGR